MLASKNLLAYQPTALLELLSQWQQAGLIKALDLAFARFLYGHKAAVESSTDINSTTLLLAALLSHQVGRGHVCLPLAPLFVAPEALLNIKPESFYNANGEAIPGLATLLNGVTQTDLIAALKLSSPVFTADLPGISASTTHNLYQGEPLVLAAQPPSDTPAEMATALYLYRYWQYEQSIAADLQALMQPVTNAFTESALPETHLLNSWLDELFTPDPAVTDTSASLTAINWQKLACVNTLRSQFSVITGGPGTGKTYTVVRLLALLQRLHASSHPTPLVIKLAAPTGKAAARLKESIQAAASSLKALPESWATALNRITAESSTLHKLLGVQAGSRQFKHRRGQPLALDVLIVDEASMVDIELMQALLAALPRGARLVLLGDKDQLASVEAGAVLGQLCAGAEQGGYRPETLAFLQQFCQTPLPAWLQQLAGPAHLQHVVMLRVSRRFNDSSGIGALARAVNDAQLPALNAALAENSPYTDIRLLQCKDAENAEQQNALLEALKQLCQQGFAAYWQAIKTRPDATCSAEQLDSWARMVLNAYQSFQLLTPVREGPFGVAGLNALVQKTLSFLPAAKESSNRHDSWFEGRPVMITANDYNLNLRNGDIGMVLTSPRDGQKRAVFIDSDNKVRWILPSRLTEVETVFAMTVHKSQGSEFAHTVMVLPERDNPVLSRELIYTGITRAAKQLTLVVPNWQVLSEAVKRKTVRAGSLRL
ncbi:RecBCD enzyme subunit RecD [Alishewanella longhuensis]|uniref:RecBCD enzyme subunit RecD n=1 Tax=Alishewanella longhuensis TaxID=1091037 RepID=A0ABQ3L6F0_9ALTE|nr:exodeoxyribonuclease V subunit alpha [Alishewanella longhuensis]GHG77403.1 RecBCD enzyme subunit RecD [Alishewanella longhuensis]